MKQRSASRELREPARIDLAMRCRLYSRTTRRGASMKSWLLLVSCVMLAVQSAHAEEPAASPPDGLRLLEAVSEDWTGRHVDEVVAVCGRPTKRRASPDGGEELVYRAPMHSGWFVSPDSPSLDEFNRRIFESREASHSPTIEPMLPSPGSQGPIVIGKLRVVFLIDRDDRVHDVSVEQKLKKKYSRKTSSGAE